jgi:hypothetical protein
MILRSCCKDPLVINLRNNFCNIEFKHCILHTAESCKQLYILIYIRYWMKSTIQGNVSKLDYAFTGTWNPNTYRFTIKDKC